MGTRQQHSVSVKPPTGYPSTTGDTTVAKTITRTAPANVAPIGDAILSDAVTQANDAAQAGAAQAGAAQAGAAPTKRATEKLRAEKLETLAQSSAETAFTLWAQADTLRKDARTRTADVYRALRLAQTGEGQSPSEGTKTLDAAIMTLAGLRSKGVPKQVIPNAQSIRTTYARALINPMMGESDKALIKGWILAGNALRSGAAEALYKRADGFGVDLS